MIEGLVLGLHLFSQHAPAKENQNNSNLGIYARTQDGWTAGVYRNTHERNSFYLGNMMIYQPRPNLDLALTIGVVNGYKKRQVPITCEEAVQKSHNQMFAHMESCFQQRGFSEHEWTLLAAPSIRYEFVRFSHIPRIGEHSAVYHLAVEKKF